MNYTTTAKQLHAHYKKLQSLIDAGTVSPVVASRVHASHYSQLQNTFNSGGGDALQPNVSMSSKKLEGGDTDMTSNKQPVKNFKQAQQLEREQRIRFGVALNWTHTEFTHSSNTYEQLKEEQAQDAFIKTALNRYELITKAWEKFEKLNTPPEEPQPNGSKYF